MSRLVAFIRRRIFRTYIAFLLALGLILWTWVFSSIYRAMQP